ncbi:leucine-rich repeat domain-containing protein [Treponema pedis]|uniref:leucine-rich repeat domain-containing protein n=1 Tax=Treponema pedis TaxID=409322 RepID=UPI000423B3BA|nr:leucine-rich repeat domain-containing protein [Treponema pedis]
MKQRNVRRAVNFTALVLAAGLLMGLLTGCPQSQPGNSKPQTGNSEPQTGNFKPQGDTTIFKTDGYGRITGYTCTKEELPAILVIPAKIGDEVITKIGGAAFDGCTGLTEVKLPASLTTIDWNAFKDCTGLKSIDLSGCTSLTTIDWKAFKDCTGLTEVKLPASLTEIVEEAFEGCTGLKSIDLSGCTSLTKIGEETFKDCTGLKSIDLSGCTSLAKIGRYAFKGCMGLTEVKLPASLTEMGSYAFNGCTGLTSAVFADTNGWAVYGNEYYSGTPTPINSSELATPATAAQYLRELSSYGGYCDKYWKKN